jgi:hypothetical protein
MTIFVNEFILNTIRDLPNTETEEPYRYVYTVLHKLNAGLDTAAFLVREIEASYQFTDSVFIILRSLLSDSIMYYHIINKSKGNVDEIKRLIQSLYFDHFEHMLKDPAFISRLSGISNKEAEAQLNQVKMGHPEFYNANGTAKVESLKASVRSALNFALVNPIEPIIRTSMQAQFHYYDIFSKYEHFGYLTYDLTHRQYDEKKIPNVVSDITTSITSLMPTYLSAIGFWPGLKRQFEPLFLDHYSRLSALSPRRTGASDQKPEKPDDESHTGN